MKRREETEENCVMTSEVPASETWAPREAHNIQQKGIKRTSSEGIETS